MKHLAPVFALALAVPPAFAQTTETSLELVLLADGSGSIDADELAFQRQGYAEAITSPEVLSAIETTLYGHIAVVYMEWGHKSGGRGRLGADRRAGVGLRVSPRFQWPTRQV